MKSMTGFGKAEYTLNDKTLTVEMKSVNNRFLDVNIKMPKAFSFLEEMMRKEIQSVVKRGRVDCYLTFADNSTNDKAIQVDMALAKSYVETAKKLQSEFCLINDYSVSDLMSVQNIIKQEVREDEEEFLMELAKNAVKLAVCEMDKMRKVEGEEMQKDLTARLNNIIVQVEKVKEISPKVVSEYKNKLNERISELLQDVQVDVAKLANEVAYFADKCNVDEEIARLNSHIVQTREMFKSNEPIGRKLDFIVQELNREANTICSKANNIAVTNIGLELKTEIEKVREQIQNIE